MFHHVPRSRIGVQSHLFLYVVQNLDGNGSILDGLFTLIPCNKSKPATTKDAFNAFTSIISSAPATNQRGVHCRPEFESLNRCQCIAFGAYPPRNKTGICDSMKGIEKWQPSTNKLLACSRWLKMLPRNSFQTGTFSASNPSRKLFIGLDSFFSPRREKGQMKKSHSQRKCFWKEIESGIV